jgi:hypothetical protein
LPPGRKPGDRPQQTHDSTPGEWDALWPIRTDIKINVNSTYLLDLHSHSSDNVSELNEIPRISVHHDSHTDTLWVDSPLDSKLV